MISIEILTFNPFQENTYVVAAESGECVIIDAGNYSEAENRTLKDHIAARGLKPIMAINTHGHVDHMLGVEYAKKEFGIPFALHSEDNFLIDTAQSHGKLYGFEVGELPTVDIDLKTQKTIMVGKVALEIIETPGHTPGHISIFEPQSRVLFCGDTLFKGSIGRTDLPGGDYSWIMKSILDNIVPLGDDVTIFPGHGAKSTIGYELDRNPFIVEVLQGDVNIE